VDRFDADPDPTPSLTPVRKSTNFFLSYIHCSTSFVFLVSVMGIIIFNILNSKLKYLEKITLSFHFVEIDTYPDPFLQTLDALRICQNYADPILSDLDPQHWANWYVFNQSVLW
jgi:hypothetical protein